MSIENEVDIKKIIEEFYPEYQYQRYQARGYYIEEGRPVVYIPISKIYGTLNPNIRYVPIKNIRIDLQTGQHELADVENAKIQADMFANFFSDEYAILNYTNIAKINGIIDGLPVRKPYNWKATPYEKLLMVRVYISKLPMNNDRLYAEFPELKKYTTLSEEERDKLYVDFLLDDSLSWQEVLELFMEEGQEINYDGWEYDLTSLQSAEQFYEIYTQKKGTDEEQFEKKLNSEREKAKEAIVQEKLRGKAEEKK